ncbi:hypothetical protein SARC_13320 [Sphaeroforma arctica JP610]|uniref:CRA domain-containing protein n=1 Tax=Sphaeroforma arctica JP610 TaxID=667725 RepID=A0A0L0FDK0_9EUKA|nr:hypothetical protein SARC_13320 [Sphaeroforma arctica JP610]KNC74123.1 hypothetical protein SARC_13320 [Sphaeroforma arctica JP610]|eukprot:XP_014148025.1 hypothetical protein SARC_13320 [Sphaeroforma arctica JP610]
MLNSLLRFGKDLQKEADTTEELGDQERKKMSNAFSLLAYRDPENSCLAYILAKEEREKLAEELNTCILKCLNIPRVNPIEMLLKQVQVCLDAALERDIASAALVNVKDCLK